MSVRLNKWDIFLTLFPALLWGLVIISRPHLLEATCLETPEVCAPDVVPWPDRLSISFESPVANTWSFATQNTAAIMAFGAPVALHMIRGVTQTVSWPVALGSIITDFVIMAQISLWNGAAMESARVLTQRPRPFVFKNQRDMPENELNESAKNPSHYTSFYSGHTSFTAAATMGLLLMMIGHKVSIGWVGFFAINSLFLTFLTGLFRVLAGRHFVSDVLVAAVAGSIIAWTVVWFHSKRKHASTS